MRVDVGGPLRFDQGGGLTAMPFTFKLSLRWSRFRSVAVAATLVVGACEFQRALTSAAIDRIELSPATITVQPYQTTDFTAVAFDRNGDTADVAVTWSATAGSITDMGVNGKRHLGQYQHGDCGTFQVIVTSHPGAKADTASVTVTCSSPNAVATVELTPASASLEVGRTVQLTAIPKDASGNPLSGRVVTWASDNTTVATVNTTGLVTAAAAGSATIWATSEGRSGTAAIAVVPAPPPGTCQTSSSAWLNSAFATQAGSFTAEFDATPNSAAMDGLTGLSAGGAGAVTDLAVIVRFNTSGRIDARNGGAYAAASTITYTPGTSYRFRLVVDVPTHTYSAYVTPAGGTEATVGVGYAFRSEQSAVTALANLAIEAGGGTHTVCNFAITSSAPPVPVASVEVTPASATIDENGAVQVTATAKDASGNPLPGRTVIWSSSNTTVATVSGSGLVTGKMAGSATITATSEGQSGTSAITVVRVPIASVTVTPSATSVQVGSGVQLTATPRDANGTPLSGRVVTWASSDNAIATVDGSGLVAGAAVGSATITATSEGQSGTSAITVTAAPPPGSGVVLVGAGDIAGCSSSGDEATALLLDNIPGTVFTAGDNAYSSGTASEFTNCYDPTWGRHKARTRPSPGNHDYNTSGATGYYNYFGANAGPSGRGYYSFDLGDWHVISLNSNISMSAGSTQEQWLRADLAANTKRCTIAYWHHPRFSSGSHGSSTSPQPLWQALYDFDADVVVSGHDHNYQRFAPQTPTGVADPVRGIREFIAGTGGISHYSFGTPIANTEAYNTDSYGVLKLTLYADSYTWEFIPVAGKTYTDSGSGSCH